jgi:hypothetical protein
VIRDFVENTLVELLLSVLSVPVAFYTVLYWRRRRGR